MTILKVLYYPDPGLFKKAEPIKTFDEALHQQIDDMFETMYEHKGVGLAGTQVAYHHRVFIMDCSDNQGKPRVIINPEILVVDDVKDWTEGCISFPDTFEKTQRGQYCKARFQDKHGNTHEEEFHGLEAVCVQHETDHLDGKTMMDMLSPLKRMRVEKRLKKLSKRRL